MRKHFIGMIAITFKEKSEHRQKNIRILEFLSKQISENLSFYQEKALLDHSMQSILFYRNSIREINRLISRNFLSESDLFSSYLDLAIDLFSFSSAYLIRYNNSIFEIFDSNGKKIKWIDRNPIELLKIGNSEFIEVSIENDTRQFGSFLFFLKLKNGLLHKEYLKDLLEILAKNLAKELEKSFQEV